MVSKTFKNKIEERQFLIDLCRQFNTSGKELWLVGGAVRDFLLDIETNDYDFATDATNEENNIKLLNELLDVPFEDRKASYRCVIVYMRFPDDPYPFISFGSWDGYIGLEPKGKNGFGYDPIFYLPEYEQTSAQISSSEKNKISHRAKALLKLEEFISRT